MEGVPSPWTPSKRWILRKEHAKLGPVIFDIQLPKLLPMGWTDFFRAQLSEEEFSQCLVARVVEPLRGLSRVASAIGEIWAEGPENIGVGDWVVGTVRGALEKEKRLSITRILDRQTKLSRTPPSGKKFEQILCANAETVFIVVAMTQELHLPGIERAIEAARQGGLAPVIVLTKADACESPDEVTGPVSRIAVDLPLHIVSVRKNEGLEPLATYFAGNRLVVLLGASGAGKSSLTNYLLQTEAQRVSATRERDEKGRHTTTARRLHFLPTGGMVVDSPGIRELQLWKEPEAPRKDSRPKPKRPPRHYDRDDDE